MVRGFEIEREREKERERERERDRERGGVGRKRKTDGQTDSVGFKICNLLSADIVYNSQTNKARELWLGSKEAP